MTHHLSPSPLVSTSTTHTYMSNPSIPTNLRYKLIRGKRDWRFVIQSVNGNIIATGQGYSRRANALKSLNLIKPAGAPIVVVA